MKIVDRLVFVSLLLVWLAWLGAPFAHSQVQNTPTGAVISVAGGTASNCLGASPTANSCVLIPNLYGAYGVTVEEKPSGSPASLSVTIQGCMRGGTCDAAADTNTSTSAAIRGITFTKVYDVFIVVAGTLSGGTNPAVTINPKLSTANSHSAGGAGTVVGPGVSVAGDIAGFADTTGALLSDLGFGFPLANSHLANSSVTVNGQTATLGGASANVNSGAANHSLAINGAAGAPLTGVGPGTTNQLLAAVASADPVLKSWADLTPTQYVAGGGTAQVQTATLAPPATSLVAGLEVNFLPNAANTGAAPTFAVNGLTAKPITKYGTTALVANDLLTTAIASVIYDGTEWQLQNPQTVISAGAGLNQSAAGVISLSLPGNNHALTFDGGAGILAELGSPVTNCVYQVVYNVTASAGVDPTAICPGVPVTTPATPYTVASTDRLTYLRLTGGTTFALTMCQITGTCANNFGFVIQNGNSGLLTMTANAADKIDNSATGGSSTLLSNFAAWLYQDSSSGPGNWWTIKVPTLAAFGSTCATGLNWSTSTGFGCVAASTGHAISSVLVCAAASASGTAYTCSTSPTFTPADGDIILFQVDVASGASPTLVVNSQAGTPSLRKNGGATVLGANDLVANEDILLQYDGANWQLQGQPLAVMIASSIFASLSFQGPLNTSAVTVSSGLGNTNANGLAPALILNGEDVTGTGSASVGGTSILRGGLASNATPSAASLAGPAQVASGALKGSAIANVGDVICSTTTAETVTDCPLGANNVVGIATTTAAPVTYVSNGVTVVKTDNATTIGDVICSPSVTAGLAHDGGTGSCSIGTYIGTVLANSGTNAVNIAAGLTTAPATPASTLPLVQLAISGGLAFAPVTNSTSVTVSNPTAATDTIMMAIPLPASYLNTVGQTFHITAAGTLNTTAASVPQVTFTPKICSVAGCASGTVTPLAAIQSSALNTTAITNATWKEDLDLIVVANGASCNFIVKGAMLIDLGAAVTTTPDTVFVDTNTAVSSPNQTCTNALFLDFFVQQSTTGASNSYKQLLGIIR